MLTHIHVTHCVLLSYVMLQQHLCPHTSAVTVGIWTESLVTEPDNLSCQNLHGKR